MKQAGRLVLVMLAVATFLFMLPLQATAEEPPKPEKMKKLSFPSFEEFTTDNNIQAVVVEHKEQPLVTISLVVKAGTALDPMDKIGASDFTVNLINKGTTDKDSNELAKWIESVGGTVSQYSGNEWSTITISVLSEYIDTAFEYLQDIILNPTFPADELEEYRKRIKTALEMELSQPTAVAGDRFAEVVYGEHPYSKDATVETVEALTRDDILSFYKQNYVANNVLFAVVGDVKWKDVRKSIEQYFGEWAQGTPGQVAYADPPAVPSTGIYLYNKPGAVQTVIYAGHTGLKPDNPDWAKVTVANRILGGGADARLFMNLREDKGWTYGAYSSFNKTRDIGRFRATAEVRTEVTDSALVEMLGEFKRIVNEPVTQEELDNAKNYLIGNFPITIETPGQIASQVVEVKLLGLGKEYLENYRDRIAAVTIEDVQQAMQTYLHPDNLDIILVGDAVAIYDKVAKIANVKLFDLEGEPVTMASLSVEPVDYEYDTSVLKKGSATYGLKMQTMDLGDLNVTIERGQVEDVPAIMVSSSLSGMLALNQSVTFRADNLMPLGCKSKMTAGPQEMTSELTFDGYKVSGTVKGMQETEPTAVDKELVEGTILNDQVEFALAALPLEVGAKFRFPVIETNSGAVSNVYAEVLDEEQVTVPAGNYDVFKIKLKMSEGEAFLYAMKDAPHTMVKHEIPAQGLVIELKQLSK